MNRIKIFLWHCSGASIPLLKRCPTEGPKYVGLGATILFTGILAALSSAFAFYLVFEEIYLAIALGILWGGMIFNLDRFIVLSMRKSETRYHEFIQAVPRFILAILIAVVISKPLEMKIFGKEISTELTLLKQELILGNREIIRSKYQGELDSIKSEITSLNNAIAVKAKQRDELVEMARQEADGTGGTGKVNPGPIYNIKKKNADLVQEELTSLRASTDMAIMQLKSRSIELSTAQNEEFGAVNNVDASGLSYQLLALDRLGNKYSAVYFADWFIVLLMICIEISPILAKLLSSRGPYDELLGVREHFYRNYRKEKVSLSDIILDQKLSKA